MHKLLKVLFYKDLPLMVQKFYFSTYSSNPHHRFSISNIIINILFYLYCNYTIIRLPIYLKSCQVDLRSTRSFPTTGRKMSLYFFCESYISHFLVQRLEREKETQRKMVRSRGLRLGLCIYILFVVCSMVGLVIVTSKETFPPSFLNRSPSPTPPPVSRK